MVSKSKFASAIASSEATIAYCVNLSILRASFLLIKSVGLKFLTSHAKRVLDLEASKCVIGAAPLTPLTKAFQYSSILLPMGVKAPSPVTTTRFNCI